MAGGSEEILDESARLVRDGQLTESAALLMGAVERFPEDAQVAVSAAISQIIDAPDEAGRLALRAQELAPADPVILTQVAGVLVTLERAAEAKAAASEAIRLAPDDFHAMYELSFVAGRIAVGYEDFEMAERFLIPPFEAHPEVDGYGLQLGLVLESQGRFADALEVAERAFEHLPHSEPLEDLLIRSRVNVHGPSALPPGVTLEPPEA